MALAANIQAQDPAGPHDPLSSGNFHLRPRQPLIVNLRLNGDIWSNLVHEFKKDPPSFLTVMGIDSHKVFNNGHRDMSTAAQAIKLAAADRKH
jgi:hypothetical protein